LVVLDYMMRMGGNGSVTNAARQSSNISRRNRHQAGVHHSAEHSGIRQ